MSYHPSNLYAFTRSQKERVYRNISFSPLSQLELIYVRKLLLTDFSPVTKFIPSEEFKEQRDILAMLIESEELEMNE